MLASYVYYSIFLNHTRQDQNKTLIVQQCMISESASHDRDIVPMVALEVACISSGVTCHSSSSHLYITSVNFAAIHATSHVTLLHCDSRMLFMGCMIKYYSKWILLTGGGHLPSTSHLNSTIAIVQFCFMARNVSLCWSLDQESPINSLLIDSPAWLPD